MWGEVGVRVLSWEIKGKLGVHSSDSGERSTGGIGVRRDGPVEGALVLRDWGSDWDTGCCRNFSKTKA